MSASHNPLPTKKSLKELLEEWSDTSSSSDSESNDEFGPITVGPSINNHTNHNKDTAPESIMVCSNTGIWIENLTSAQADERLDGLCKLIPTNNVTEGTKAWLIRTSSINGAYAVHFRILHNQQWISLNFKNGWPYLVGFTKKQKWEWTIQNVSTETIDQSAQKNAIYWDGLWSELLKENLNRNYCANLSILKLAPEEAKQRFRKIIKEFPANYRPTQRIWFVFENEEKPGIYTFYSTAFDAQREAWNRIDTSPLFLEHTSEGWVDEDFKDATKPQPTFLEAAKANGVDETHIVNLETFSQKFSKVNNDNNNSYTVVTASDVPCYEIKKQVYPQSDEHQRQLSTHAELNRRFDAQTMIIDLQIEEARNRAKQASERKQELNTQLAQFQSTTSQMDTRQSANNAQALQVSCEDQSAHNNSLSNRRK